MTYKLNTNRNPIPDPEYGSNMHTEGSRTSVNTTLKGTKTATCSWPDVQQQGFVSSYGMDPSTNHRGVGYSITFMTLLHPWAYLAIPVITVAHRAHSCVGDCHLLLQQPAQHPLTPCKLVSAIWLSPHPMTRVCGVLATKTCSTFCFHHSAG